MARMKALLYKVPGYDQRTALQQWLLGLKQPYRLEAAKGFPKTLADGKTPGIPFGGHHGICKSR